MANTIEGWEIKDHGELKVHTYTHGHRIEHCWYGVKKATILKVLNAKKPPALSDIEGWINEDEARDKAKHKGDLVSACAYGWYSEYS